MAKDVAGMFGGSRIPCHTSGQGRCFPAEVNKGHIRESAGGAGGGQGEILSAHFVEL